MSNQDLATLTRAVLNRCARCGEYKPVSEFSPSSVVKTGCFSYCKPCNNADWRERYHNNLKHNPLYRLTKKVHQQRQKEKNPHKSKARSLARANKHLIKKETCESCGATRDLHMHHYDYTKPLEVVTLCRSCHNGLHGGGGRSKPTKDSKKGEGK